MPMRLTDSVVTLCDVMDAVRDALTAAGIQTGEPDGHIVVTGEKIAVLAGDERTPLGEDWTLIRVYPQDDPVLVAGVVQRSMEAAATARRKRR